MNVISKPHVPADKNPKYPYIGQVEKGKTLVLFTAPGTGTVLLAGPFHNMGEHSKEWLECDFVLYRGVITIDTRED